MYMTHRNRNSFRVSNNLKSVKECLRTVVPGNVAIQFFYETPLCFSLSDKPGHMCSKFPSVETVYSVRGLGELNSSNAIQ